MQKQFKGVTFHYVDYGSKEGKTILFLHGWGQNIQMMKPVADAFQKDYRILILDLPGFGESEEPKEIWTLQDYVDCIYDLVSSLDIENPILFGHSFGGKIALLYASCHPTLKLIVCGSPYKKEIPKLSWKTKTLKQLKKLPGMTPIAEKAKKYIGSRDYKNASPMMRKILVEHVNLDLTEEVKKIKTSTLILWGEEDQEVSIDEAYELEKYIPDAGVVPYPGCSHYAYLEGLKKTIQVVRIFLES